MTDKTTKSKKPRRYKSFSAQKLPNKITLTRILPTLLTIAGLSISFHAIKFVLNGHVGKALLAMFAAIICDMLDGRVARILNVSSKIGAELDSLSDMVSFGVVPTVISYFTYLNLFPRVGWLACTFFVICGALRLAKFNVNSTEIPQKYFEGIPIPAAAAVSQLPILFMNTFFNNPTMTKPIAILGILLMIFLSIMMVSKVPTPSMKNFKISKGVLTLSVLTFTLLTALFINYTWQLGLLLNSYYFIYIIYCTWKYLYSEDSPSLNKEDVTEEP